MQIVWKGHALQVLVKVSTKGQTLQTGWQGYALPVLVEGSTKRQALQTGWKGHVLQVVIKGSTKRLALQTGWKGHVLQVLVKRSKPLFFDCDSLVFENDSFILGEKCIYFFAFQFGMVFQHVFSFSRDKLSC